MDQAELTEAPARPEPWKEVRALRPGEILVRVIDVARGMQFFLSIEPTQQNLAKGAAVRDGSTYITPGRARPRPDDEIDMIVDAADLAWGGLAPHPLLTVNA